jgi:tetratricopeptide (TPR) repeat protein
MQRHIASVQAHFAGRAAILANLARREDEALARKAETQGRRAKVLAELREADLRAARGEVYTDQHALHVDMSRAHERWMAFDVVKGAPRELPFASVDNLTKAHHYVRRGLGKREGGQDEAAIELYTKAIRVDPRYTVANLLRGAASMRLSRFSAAIRDFTTCLAANRRE